MSMPSMRTTLQRYDQLLAWPAPLVDLLARLYIAEVFLRSGWSKFSDWDTTLYLFADEYRVPLLPTQLAAVIGTGGELLFPLMLVFGLMTRFSAAGLFCLNIMAVVSYWHVLGNSPVAIQDHIGWGMVLAMLTTYQGHRWEITRLQQPEKFLATTSAHS